jgi:hypothetical protein
MQKFPSLEKQFDQKTLKLIQEVLLKGKDFPSACGNIFIKEFPCERFLFVPRGEKWCREICFSHLRCCTMQAGERWVANFPRYHK